MKAIVFERNGGLEVLQYKDTAEPKPGPNEVVLQVKAIGVQFQRHLGAPRTAWNENPDAAHFRQIQARPDVVEIARRSLAWRTTSLGLGLGSAGLVFLL